MPRPKFGCTSCGEGFGSLKAFDRHLGPIIDAPQQLPCRDPNGLSALARNAHGWWAEAHTLGGPPKSVRGSTSQPVSGVA